LNSETPGTITVRDASGAIINDGTTLANNPAAVPTGAIAVVFAPGATVGVTTIEFEPGAVADLRALLDRLIPRSAGEQHNVRNQDSNGHAHLRAALIGPSESVPVVAGELALGTWQQIVLVDFDERPRDREVSVHVVS